MLITCHCQHCNGAIEFDPEVNALDSDLPCGRCGHLARLYMPANRGRGIPRRRGDDLVRYAYAGSVLMPVVGFFLGIYLLTQRKPEHGLAAMAISILLFFFYFAAITNLF